MHDHGPPAAAQGFSLSAAGATHWARPWELHGGRRACSVGLLGGALLWPDSSPCGGAAWGLARTAEEKQTAEIFRRATPSVVSVVRGKRSGDLRRGSIVDGRGAPFGSGFVWDAEHVVTNFHVVRDLGPDNLSVMFLGGSKREDSQSFPTRLVGVDAATDSAVLLVADQAGRKAMRPLALGESEQLEVGQTVYAIGNPFGLEHSLSRGVISGISRTLDVGDRPIQGCIQTDASINPGNSGGPLLDSQGQVIGMNTAVLSRGGASTGVGLAVPIDAVRRAVEMIISNGYVRRAFLGIIFAADVVSEQLQLPGLVVVGVVPGSPAERAGVRPMLNGVLGDVVSALDGERIRTGSDFFGALDNHAPGDVVTLLVQRALRQGPDVGAEEFTLNATLTGTRP